MKARVLLILMILFQYFLMWGVLPLWALVLNGVLLLISIVINLNYWPKLPAFWMNLLALGGVGFGLYQLNSFWTVDSGDYFILTLMVVRSLRIEHLWQKRFMVYSSVVLLMSYLIVNQDFMAMIWMMLDLILIFLNLFSIESQSQFNVQLSLKKVLRAMIYSIPFWLTLFFIFPRFNISFFNLKISQASVGFSGNLNPGQIENIVKSKELAFRAVVNSKKKMLQRNELYWRGLYFDDFEGLEWRPPQMTIQKPVVNSKALRKSADFVQKITLSASAVTPWVLSLGYVNDVRLLDLEYQDEDLKINYLGSHIFKFSKTPEPHTTYEVFSTDEGFEEENVSQYLKIPANIDPRIQKLAQELGANASTLTQKINRVMAYFLVEKFRYTLEPGNYGENGLSEFIFKRKIGFCEHFAAAFATLMRLMDVPTRVVVGYQGGEYNRAGNFWLISQQDAHAWAEVYDDKAHGWRRADPTVWIEPLRIEMGGAYNQLTDEELEIRRSGSLDPNIKSFFKAMRDEVQAHINQLKDSWENFILNYNLEYQRALWSEILEEYKKERVFNSIFLILLVYVLYRVLVFWKHQWSEKDPYREIFKRVENRAFKKLSLQRNQGESEAEFLERLVSATPTLVSATQEFWQAYCSCRYAEQTPKKQLVAKLNQLLREIHP